MVVDEGHGNAHYTDQQFMEAVSKYETAGTTDIADEVGCTARTADYRLKELRDEGRVESKTIGGSLIWTIPGEGQ